MARAPRWVVGNLAEDGLVRSLGEGRAYARLEFTLRKPIRMAEAPRWINGHVAPGCIEVNVRIASQPAIAVVAVVIAGTRNARYTAGKRCRDNNFFHHSILVA